MLSLVERDSLHVSQFSNPSMIKTILKEWPFRVSYGPFKGTKCFFTSSGDGVIAKLAGTYELEIYPAFNAAIQSTPDIVVDIGAAEGFYVAGLARALPGAKVIAYEAKDQWHERIQRLLAVNKVSESCEIRGFCDRVTFLSLLRECPAARLFLLMDIEGGEFDLLTPETIPLLANAELLVELHEPESRNAGDAVAEGLAPSHDVKFYWSRSERSSNDVAYGWWKLAASLLPAVRERLNERRAYKMRWLYAKPRRQSSEYSRK